MLVENPADRLWTLHTPRLPQGVDDARVRNYLLEQRSIEIAGGFGPLAGKVFRIGHLGECNELTLLGALSGVEMGLAKAGVPHRSGGVEVAIKSLEEPSQGNAPSHLKIVKS